MKLMYKLTILTITAFLYANATLAQSGKIMGKVIDKKTGEELIGVTVVIEGTAFGAATDFEGNFTINNVKPGTYNLASSYVSYTKKIITDVVVTENNVTKIDFVLEESKKELQELVITGKLKKETASALLIQQKRSVSISDGLSADMIKKTPDATTSDVMKRVSGTSIQDNKFAVIRGLNDRYNTAFINGAPLPSTESDRKAFSFDIFPSNMLDNMVITKTGSADLPGDFAGGLITINTKDIPEKKFISTSLGTSINSITTGKEGYTYQGGKTDYLGLDDGTRGLKTALPARNDYHNQTTEQKVENSLLFNDSWKTEKIGSTPANVSMQLAGGNNFKMGKNSELGFIVSGSYNNGYRYTSVERNRQNKPMANAENQLLSTYNDNVYKHEILSGLMANMGYKINNNNKISFKNALTLNSEDQTILRTGIDSYQDEQIPLVKNTYYNYQQNKLLTNQLIGEHYFTAAKLKAKWVLNNNQIDRTIPDFRRFSTRATKLDPSSEQYTPYSAQIGNNIDISQTGRFFSNLNENIKSAGLDLQKPLEIISSKKVKSEVKTGFLLSKRTRDFEARGFGYRLNSNMPNRQKFLQQPLEEIFSKSNINNNFYIDEDYRAQDVYNARANLKAGYLMMDQRFFGRFRASYGIRFESYNQNLSSFERNSNPAIPLTIDTTFNDWLPSLNTTYELTERTNLRFSAFKSVARPEFREIAPFAFYDFNLNAVVTGKSNLTRTKVDNYDLRYEFYPGMGQLISVSAFYKKFNNAIESVSELTGSDATYSYTSDANATNYGIEFEVRKNLDFADNLIGTSWLKDFSFTLNYAYIKSEVVLGDGTALKQFGTRPLQGQSPYILNTSLQYYNEKHQLSASIFVNKIGRRIAYVREKNGLIPDLWENPRTVVDFSISKTILKSFDIKLSISDLLAQDLVFYQDNNKDGKYQNVNNATLLDPNITAEQKSTMDNTVFRYKMGYNVSIGISYRL